jgi:hypothetical protein
MAEYEAGDKVCGNCNFFSTIKSECRFNPPTGNATESGWPQVKRTDWCSKFAHAPAGTFGTKQELLSRTTGGEP